MQTATWTERTRIPTCCLMYVHTDIRHCCCCCYHLYFVVRYVCNVYDTITRTAWCTRRALISIVCECSLFVLDFPHCHPHAHGPPPSPVTLSVQRTSDPLFISFAALRLYIIFLHCSTLAHFESMLGLGAFCVGCGCVHRFCRIYCWDVI